MMGLYGGGFIEFVPDHFENMSRHVLSSADDSYEVPGHWTAASSLTLSCHMFRVWDSRYNTLAL